MRRIWRRLEDLINNLQIRRKLMLLYAACMILPLVITDGVILTLLIRTEERESEHEMQKAAEAVSYELSSVFEVADRITDSLYTNRKIDEFLSKEYASDLEFYTESRDILDSAYYDLNIGYSNSQLLIYADNDTIVNGGHFHQMDAARNTDWYQSFLQTGKDDDLLVYYDDSMQMTIKSQRCVSIIRKLDYFYGDDMEKLVKLDLDYNSINRKFESMNYDSDLYVCSPDGRILFSNGAANSYTEPFETLGLKERIGYELSWSFYGDELRILVKEPSNMILNWLSGNVVWLLALIGANILFPLTLMRVINRSFVSRLQILSNAFDEVEIDRLLPIGEISGTDEIAGLTANYNRMLRRLQELIQTVYKDRLERQEMDLARQNAEIQALHSQINPHFLFNVLESIRMHSVINGEQETAEMIARLALLERQSVKWTSDLVQVSEEVQFIEAYLELQKYRFGRRLSYEIELEDGCGAYNLPRLTLSTLVENSCVHGMEGKKGSCWIYIRIYRRDGWLYLEIEDTGSGMSEETAARLLEEMRTCDIQRIRESDHVGVLNASLRLKILSGNTAEFHLESEEGAGSWFTIRVPLEKLSTGRQERPDASGSGGRRACVRPDAGQPAE